MKLIAINMIWVELDTKLQEIYFYDILTAHMWVAKNFRRLLLVQKYGIIAKNDDSSIKWI